MKKTFFTIALCLVTIILAYIILFIYTIINFNDEFKYTFKSLENLNFHKKYSKKIHHLRDESYLGILFKKGNKEDLLFSTINESDGKKIIVLFQGDSWMENITREKNHKSIDLLQKFGNKKKVGFINGGITSYSPSLMNLQLDVLQEDFQIFPDIVIAYIDQTDIGDENCRYKYNKVYKNEILDSVQPETQHKIVYNYFAIYALSEIYLNKHSKFIKTFQLINIKFKNSLRKSGLRFYRKYISSSNIQKEKLVKCYGDEMAKYLIKPSKDDIKYFANSIDEYINKVNKKERIKKLILVTFPYRGHFYANSGKTNSYTLNVSDVVDEVIKDKKNITHINFSKILLNDQNFEHESIWSKDGIHLKPDIHGDLFIKKILHELEKYLY